MCYDTLFWTLSKFKLNRTRIGNRSHMGIPTMSLTLRYSARRLLHAASSLPYVETNGVGTFLSRKGLGLITEMQAKNIDQLNASIKGALLVL